MHPKVTTCAIVTIQNFTKCYLFALIIILSQANSDYWTEDETELIELWGNHETFLKLDCKSLHKQIIVLEAFFTCSSQTNYPEKVNDVKHAINKRCSGKNVCSFIFEKDCKDSKSMGNGTIYVQYACVNEKDVIKTCSANVTVRKNEEGFIQTPGYPKYYVGGRPCLWTLRGQDNIQLRFMDITLRGVGPLEKQCQDWLIVNEHGLDMLATCGDIFKDIIITSTGPEVNISLTTSSINIFPKRGLLIHYQGVGVEEIESINYCEKGSEPRGSQLVVLNNTHALYRCMKGYLFAETKSRDLIILCRYHHPRRRHIQLNCVLDQNITLDNVVGLENEMATNSETGDFYSDVVGPCVVLALLLLGNVFVVAFVYYHKKRLLANGEDPWVAEPLRERRSF